MTSAALRPYYSAEPSGNSAEALSRLRLSLHRVSRRAIGATFDY